MRGSQQTKERNKKMEETDLIYVVAKDDDGDRMEFNWSWKGPQSLAEAYEVAKSMNEGNPVVGFKWHFC